MSNHSDSKATEICTLSGNLKSFTVLQMVTLLHEARKTGRFLVETKVQEKTAQKTLFLDRGEVIFASSNLTEDRLGECLVRLGRINKDQFDQASKILMENPGNKLGKILVEHNIITPGQLWTGVKNQVEHIFLSILQIKDGQFTFLEGKTRPPAIVRLPHSVRDLILQGVAHLDELKIFAEKVISRDSVFEKVNPVPKGLRFNEVERELMGLIDGQKTVRAILVQSTSSAFVTLNVLSKLMLGKAIALKKADLQGSVGQVQGAQPPTESPVVPPRSSLEGEETTGAVLTETPKVQAPEVEKPPENLFGLFHKNNQAYVEIQRCLQEKGIDLSQDLQDYFSDQASPYFAFFAGQKWLPQGGFDPGKFFAHAQLSQGHHTVTMAILSQALEDLLFFLLFKAQGLLAKNESESLMQKIEEFQRDDR